MSFEQFGVGGHRLLADHHHMRRGVLDRRRNRPLGLLVGFGHQIMDVRLGPDRAFIEFAETRHDLGLGRVAQNGRQSLDVHLDTSVAPSAAKSNNRGSSI